MCACVRVVSYFPTPLIIPIDTRTALITAWVGGGGGGGVKAGDGWEVMEGE